MTPPTQPEPDLAREAQWVRESGALGRPGPLSRLFEFLLARSGGPAPKEIEIAVEAFGKGPDFDVTQDSLVRVYVHKLRKRLDDQYARSARPARIAIPRGEYRLVLERGDDRFAVAPHAVARPARRARLLFAVVVVAVLALGALGMYVWTNTVGLSGEERNLRAVRANAVWAPILNDETPIVIAVGDYYLLGETDRAGNVARLVREFHINSQADFIDHLELDPQRMQRYRNLDLTYLPAAIAFAMHDVAPVLESKSDVRVMLMSDLDGETLAASHIVYVGYLSGLGMLGDVVFDASRLQLGGTYDELVDPSSRRSYIARQPPTPGAAYTDYGYFASLRTPTGHRMLVIAGTRDLGVMQMAEALTRRESLESLATAAADADSFESLTQVHGVANASMNAKRLFVAPIERSREE